MATSPENGLIRRAQLLISPFKMPTKLHSTLTSAIDDLSNLKDGWLEGQGVAPNRMNLEQLSDDLVEVFPPGIGYPAVVPTEDGNVSLEWIKPTSRIELEVNFAENRLELYATDIETDRFIEESFAMTDWQGAFGKITALIDCRYP